MDKVGRQYIVVLSIYNYSNERVAEIGQGLTRVLENISTEKIELAFRSVAYDIVAYFVRSKMVARQIRAAIESPQRGIIELDGFFEGFLRSEDNLLIIELADDKDASQGLSRALTWLQRH